MSDRVTTLGNPIHTMRDGTTCCDSEMALAHLLANDVVFTNSRPYWCAWRKKMQPSTTVIFVHCGDLFAWGDSDGEEMPSHEIETVYRAFDEHGTKGVERWCCLRRGMRPQARVEGEWRESGFWDAALEALPETTT